MTDTLELAKQLICIPSVTPEDLGCQKILADRLGNIGFTNEHLRYGEVDNLWARHGTQAPLFVFAGHTDVVPTGPVEQWSSDPFTPTIINDVMTARGTADMKSSIAACSPSSRLLMPSMTCSPLPPWRANVAIQSARRSSFVTIQPASP